MLSALTNHIWQSTLFAIAAALFTLAFRKNRAPVRYALWLAASLKFLVPFALLIALGTNLWSTLAERNIPTEIASPAVSQALVQAAQPVSDAFAFSASMHHTSDWPLIAIFVIWACGFFAIASMRFRAWLRVCSALRSSTPLDIASRSAEGTSPLGGRSFSSDISRLSSSGALVPEAMHSRCSAKSFQIRSTPGLLEPGVVGLFRPALLLPEGILQNLTPPQFEAVLAHELAHICRRDNLTAALHMLVEAIFWFHPLVWWTGARLVDERERACDEAVLSLGNQPRDYAEAILNVCKLYVESPLACAAGVTGADLKKRIHAILDGQLTSELNFAKKCGLALVGLAALALPIIVGLINTPSLRAQSEEHASLSFEVASVKPDPDESHYFGNHIDITSHGDLYHATGVTASYLIKYAYALSNEQLSEGPDWINSDKYAIDAKIPDPIVAGWHTTFQRAKYDEQMREMMRSLLADRFQLKIGHETKELPVFALVVAKGGPKFTASKDDGSHSGNDGHNNGDVEIEQIANRPIATLVEVLQGQPEVEGRKVLDQTGLTATYTYPLKWTRQRPLSTSTDAAQPTSEAPALEDALENQLGLQLKSAKAPIDTIVITHIEKPRPN